MYTYVQPSLDVVNLTQVPFTTGMVVHLALSMLRVSVSRWCSSFVGAPATLKGRIGQLPSVKEFIRLISSRVLRKIM